jgi:hypothetical protein
MPRGRKSEETNNGVLNLIALDENLIEDNTKTPNIQIDDCGGISVDKNGNWELVKIDQTTVTEDNIKTATNSFGDKYTIGDTYQQWSSMGKYLDSYVSAVETYAKLRFLDEVSKLKYCRDISKLVEIQTEIKDSISKFAVENVVPQIVKDIGLSMNQLQSIKKDIAELQELKKTMIEDCNEFMNVVAEKRNTMIAKGIIEQKKTKHRIKEEEQ